MSKLSKEKIDYTIVEGTEPDAPYAHKILYKGEEVFYWNDEWSTDCPEDLCWGRMISEVFNAGIELGKRIAKEEK